MTFATALPHALRMARRGGYAAILGCPRVHAPHELRPKLRQQLPELDWSMCPLSIFDSPHWQMLHRIHEAAKMSPLAGWPDRYAAWIPLTLPELYEVPRVRIWKD